MGYVLPSFGLSSAQIASSLNRYARISLRLKFGCARANEQARCRSLARTYPPSFTDDLPSKIASKSDKAN